LTRRTLLAILAGLAAAAVAWLALARPDSLGRALARRLKPTLDPTSATGALSDPEMETLLAFAEALLGDHPLSPGDRHDLAEHVRGRTGEVGGYLALYRMTARLLDGLAGGRFAGLGRAERARVLERHRLANRKVWPIEYALPFRRRELAVRVLAVPDLVAGYYLSPAGWRLVGYTAVFPGRCGGLQHYTRGEG
jgi:hypothetical protein